MIRVNVYFYQFFVEWSIEKRIRNLRTKKETENIVLRKLKVKVKKKTQVTEKAYGK